MSCDLNTEESIYIANLNCGLNTVGNIAFGITEVVLGILYFTGTLQAEEFLNYAGTTLTGHLILILTSLCASYYVGGASCCCRDDDLQLQDKQNQTCIIGILATLALIYTFVMLFNNGIVSQDPQNIIPHAGSFIGLGGFSLLLGMIGMIKKDC